MKHTFIFKDQVAIERSDFMITMKFIKYKVSMNKYFMIALNAHPQVKLHQYSKPQ